MALAAFACAARANLGGRAAEQPAVQLALLRPAGSEAISSSDSPGRLVLPFEFVDGLMVCKVPSSLGLLRLIIDTGANGTALTGKTKPVELRIGERQIRLVPAPLRTATLAQVNASLPPEKWLSGILGQDVLVQFRRVTLDYERMQIEFDP
ncbi:MAG: hypothetical protein ACRD1N_08120 [Terriglobia bacterium]